MEGPMVLPRAFSLLRLLAEVPHGMNLSDMAARLDMPKSSLSSTLKALTDQGFLARKGALYFLGSEAYALASTILAGRTIRQIARPYLEQTMEETGETVLLSQLDPDQKFASYIDTVESDKSIRFSVPLAARRALYCSSAGRVFLAFMTDRQRASYYDSVSLERMTDKTETDRVELEQVVAEIRQTGVAITMGTYSADAAGFGAPIFNSDGAVTAALTIGVPVSRAERDKQKYIDAAIKTAANISKTLGYSGGGKS
ncbi:IclR family transcriptional regulator [uncultured Shimia sp.]|uniref:IclR family transcriptional regulator n=1 Tax=uncultured Shimia sp. TaxID=573152 RepID=UPI0025F1B661|nr:IclR family transcriptional regulator [uncultured Shimia sp.]